jgi:hypothetical protein
MKKLSIVVVLALAAVACGKKDAPAAAPVAAGPDCGKAIANSLEVSRATMTKLGVDAKTLDKMRDLGVQHCKDDKWPADAIQCMADAKTEANAQGCYGKMAPEMVEKMNKAAMEMMTASAAAGNPGGSPAAGSGSSAGAPGNATDSGSAVAPK